MVGAPSHPGVARQEEAVALALKAFLESHGIPSPLTEVRAGRPNLIAAITGPRPGPHLVFCGHTDTVPPNAQTSGDPFSAAVASGRLQGRGSVDMKGALAAMAGALVHLKESAGLSSGRVTLAAVIDEEMESLGAEALILSGFKADAAIVGEPTGNRIAIGHKGLEWLHVEFEGKAAHGGTPEAGVNAIAAAAHFVWLVENELIPAFEKRRDPILGLPVINMGTISGGDQPSTVAARCEIKLDRRWVSTETIDRVFRDLESLLEKVRDRRPGLKTHLTRMPGGMATMLHGPLTIDPEHPLVKSAQRAFEDLESPADPLTVFPAWTDGALLSREAHIPTIIWGPGALDLAHSPAESIRLEDVFLASRLYAAAARHFTGSR
jgi:acetylornithine deacetylase/succinyl-diaminopimelate desuccinylase